MSGSVAVEGLRSACSVKEECREHARRLARVVAEVLKANGCDCLLYSGGVDTGFVLAAGLEAGLRLRLVSVVFPGGGDEEYLRNTGLEGVVEHVVRRVPLESSVVDECLERVLRVLRTIDPVEVSAGVATCLGMDLARRMGCRCVATGDAGDELFFGYSFLLGRDPGYLREWLSWVAEKGFYSSKPIGESMGLRVIHPLNTREAKEVALETPVECKVGDLGGVRVGKLLMRCHLLERGFVGIASRPKTPITSGSGVEGIVEHWARRASFEEALGFCREEGLMLPTLSHVYLYKRFRDLGLERPRPCREGGGRCPLCGSCLTERGYCRFCGAVVSRGGGVSFHGGGWVILGRLRSVCGVR